MDTATLSDADTLVETSLSNSVHSYDLLCSKKTARSSSAPQKIQDPCETLPYPQPFMTGYGEPKTLEVFYTSGFYA